MMIRLTVNGEERTTPAEGSESLLAVLRDRLELLGSKNACEQGECGSCTVILDGELVCSCLVMAGDADGARLVTVEGLADEGSLHPVQRALLDAGAVQCGFCTPGFVVAAAHLLESQPGLTPDDIREELAGNICRCTGYGAILRAMQSLSGEGES